MSDVCNGPWFMKRFDFGIKACWPHGMDVEVFPFLFLLRVFEGLVLSLMLGNPCNPGSSWWEIF